MERQIMRQLETENQIQIIGDREKEKRHIRRDRDGETDNETIRDRESQTENQRRDREEETEIERQIMRQCSDKRSPLLSFTIKD